MQDGGCPEGACCKEHCPQEGAEGVDSSNARIHSEVETDVGGAIGGRFGQ